MAARKPVLARLWSVALRCLVYYVIYLSIWKCPPGTELDSSSPCGCHSLQKVFNYTSPYTGPVYEKYVEPAYKVVKPYSDRGAEAYLKYGHPIVVRGQAATHKVLDPYAEKVSQLHDAHVKPIVDQVHELHDKHVAPHVSKGCQLAELTYDRYVLPGAKQAKPYVDSGRKVAYAKVWTPLREKGQVGADVLYSYGCKLVQWCQDQLSPKVSSLYRDVIEPQVVKIHDRVLDQGSRRDWTDLNGQTDSVVYESTQDVATATAVSESESELSSTESAISSTFTPEQTEQISSSGPSASVSEELVRWTDIVGHTTREAFATFLDDLEQEKQRLLDDVRPKFTERLQTLSQIEKDAYADLTALVNSINTTDSTVTTADVQEQFREYADKIRLAALAVRNLSEEFAEQVVNDTEIIRENTVEVLDEFAQVSLNEVGRKMVSLEKSASENTASGDSGAPNWKDWKAYRNLKDKVMNARQEIIDHEINLAEINLVLREAQETANVLAKESAQILSGLRSKADFLFQQKLQEKKRLEEETGEVEEEAPQDAEIYEEIEEDSVSQNDDNEEDWDDDDDNDNDDEYDEEQETLTLTETILFTATSADATTVASSTELAAETDFVSQSKDEASAKLKEAAERELAQDEEDEPADATITISHDDL